MLIRNSIEFASGIAGSGKTTFIRDHTVMIWDYFSPIIIAMPTIVMCETIGEHLLHKNPRLPIAIIHSENGPDRFIETDKTVACRIYDALHQAVDTGESIILICCQQSLLNIPLIPNKSETIVLWDEEFDPTDYQDKIIIPSDQESLILSGCLRKPIEGTTDYEIIEVGKEARDRIEMRLQQNDVVTAAVSNIYEKMMDAYDGKLILYRDLKTGGVNRFIMSSIRNPEFFFGFKRIVFFGARFEHSLLYKIYEHKRFGVEWKPMKEWTQAYKTKKQSHETRIEFHYALANSKHAVRYINPTLEPFLKEIAPLLQKSTTGVSKNKGYKDSRGRDVQWDLGNATEIPFGCYGIDTFKSITDLIYLGAYNKNNPYYDWIDTVFELNSNFSAHHFYQTILRTGLRDEGFDDVIRVFTPCLKLIETLLDVFPNATLQQMECSEQCEKILYELDKRHFVKEDDGRRSKWTPNLDGYVLSTRWLSRQEEMIPQKITRNLQLFQKILENSGYSKRDFTVQKTDSKGKSYRENVSVMAQFPDDFQKVLEKENWKIII